MEDAVNPAFASGNFTTLVAAVKATGLVETLKSRMPFTALVPTDDAFVKLPNCMIEDLVKPDINARIVKFLTDHVLPSKVVGASIAGKKMNVKIIEGSQFAVDPTSAVTIYGATDVIADVAAANDAIRGI